MRHWKKSFAGLLFLFTPFFCVFFATPKPHARPTHHYTGIEVLGNKDISTLWEDETVRRFPNALIYASHGTNCGGKWICQNPDNPTSLADAFYVHDLALSLRQQYPDRIIVLVICNPGHLKVGVPGVYYAKDDVLVEPDAQNTRCYVLHFLHPGCVGNIFEFVDD